jgi:hypothetical protein
LNFHHKFADGRALNDSDGRDRIYLVTSEGGDLYSGDRVDSHGSEGCGTADEFLREFGESRKEATDDRCSVVLFPLGFFVCGITIDTRFRRMGLHGRKVCGHDSISWPVHNLRDNLVIHREDFFETGHIHGRCGARGVDNPRIGTLVDLNVDCILNKIWSEINIRSAMCRLTCDFDSFSSGRDAKAHNGSSRLPLGFGLEQE